MGSINSIVVRKDIGAVYASRLDWMVRLCVEDGVYVTATAHFPITFSALYSPPLLSPFPFFIFL